MDTIILTQRNFKAINTQIYVIYYSLQWLNNIYNTHVITEFT